MWGPMPTGPSIIAKKFENQSRVERHSFVKYRIVQPYGRDVARESTLISEHATSAEAFAEIGRLAAQMARTGARPDTVTFVVIDASGAVLARPGVH